MLKPSKRLVSTALLQANSFLVPNHRLISQENNPLSNDVLFVAGYDDTTKLYHIDSMRRCIDSQADPEMFSSTLTEEEVHKLTDGHVYTALSAEQATLVYLLIPKATEAFAQRTAYVLMTNKLSSLVPDGYNWWKDIPSGINYMIPLEPSPDLTRAEGFYQADDKDGFVAWIKDDHGDFVPSDSLKTEKEARMIVIASLMARDPDYNTFTFDGEDEYPEMPMPPSEEVRFKK